MNDGYPRNFKPREFHCKCGDCLGVLPDPAATRHLAWGLQQIRDLANVPIKVNSGYRCPEHNKAIGGHPKSYHMKGWAADLHPMGISPNELHGVIEDLVISKRIPEGGLVLYPTVVHYDIQHRRRRGNG